MPVEVIQKRHGRRVGVRAKDTVAGGHSIDTLSRSTGRSGSCTEERQERPRLRGDVSSSANRSASAFFPRLKAAVADGYKQMVVRPAQYRALRFEMEDVHALTDVTDLASRDTCSKSAAARSSARKSTSTTCRSAALEW
jgi:hypothetical protein